MAGRVDPHTDWSVCSSDCSQKGESSLHQRNPAPLPSADGQTQTQLDCMSLRGTSERDSILAKNVELSQVMRKNQTHTIGHLHDSCLCYSQSCPTLYDRTTCSPAGSLSVWFSSQEYWSGLSFPSPGDLSDPRIERMSLVSPALQVDSLPLSQQGSHRTAAWTLQISVF